MGEALDRLVALSGGGSGGHDLIYFEKRSTGLVVAHGAAPSTNSNYNPETYGKQTSRKKATAAQEAKIAKGDWVPEDENGVATGQPGHKKTQMKGREHLLKKS